MAFPGRQIFLTTRDVLVYALTKSSLAILSILPPPLAFLLARGCGSLLYVLSRRRRNIALRNLDIAFRETLPAKEKRRIARRAFQHALAIFATLALRRRRSRRDNIDRIFHVSPEDETLLSAPHPHGLAFLSAHVGDWEMAQHYFTLRGTSVTVIAGGISNRLLDREMTRLRSGPLMRVIPKEGALREIRSKLRQGEAVGFLADQNSPKRQRFFDFFGVPASTYTEYAPVLARTGCRILFVACIREGFRLRFRVRVRDLGVELPEPLGDPPAAAEAHQRADEIIRRYLKAVEDLAREHAEQYWWGHRRWKSRPTGAPWLYHDLGKPLEPSVLCKQP